MRFLRIASDLHLEGFLGSDFETLVLKFLPKDDRDQESALVLAGDISSNRDQLVGFLQACLSRFKRVLFVPGNHETYKHNIDTWNAEMSDRFVQHCPGLMFATSGVSTFEYSGCRFILSTLWGDGGKCKADQDAVSWFLNDFRLIRCDTPDRKFLIQDMISTHKRMKTAIEDILCVPFDGKTIVVTHHLPSRRLVSPRFWPKDGSDGANGGFVGECDDILAKTEIAPRLWVFGHTHDCIDTSLWGTRCVSNPTGYRGEWDNGFSAGPDGTKFIELNDL